MERILFVMMLKSTAPAKDTHTTLHGQNRAFQGFLCSRDCSTEHTSTSSFCYLRLRGAHPITATLGINDTSSDINGPRRKLPKPQKVLEDQER
jgi:hypothetical protein